ncbi:MAG: bifunctional DNA primase/polymerase [Candidatus Acidiferrum sp.]
MLEVALDYARRGYKVFPCKENVDPHTGRISKAPYTARGVYGATSDKIIIQSLWKTWPNALIGLPMGEVNGLIAIDVDAPRKIETGPNAGAWTEDGMVSWQALIHQHGDVDAPFVCTPSGGCHVIFKYDDGLSAKNSVGRLSGGIDVRTTGGYVIAAGSRAADWAVWARGDHPLEDAPRIPGWLRDLLALCQPSEPAAPTTLPPLAGEHVPAIEGLCSAYLNQIRNDEVPHGTRNDWLSKKCCFTIGGLIAHLAQGDAANLNGYLAGAEEALRQAIDAAGWDLTADDRRKTKGSIRNGLRKGAAKPIAPEARFSQSPEQLASVKASLERVLAAQSGRELPPAGAAPIKATKPGKKLICYTPSADDAEATEWLWEDRLARGALHVLGGSPDAGKSTLSFEFAAIISRGGLWPDGTRAPQGNVLIYSSEDDIRKVITARLAAMGADFDFIRIIEHVVDDADGTRRPFDPSKDIALLREFLKAEGAPTLIIIDNIADALGCDGQKNVEVRRSLFPLVELASDYDTAIIAISHFTKNSSGRNPTERLNGSTAIGGVPRVVMLASAQRADEDGSEKPNVLVWSKNNLARKRAGFEYTMKDSTRLDRKGRTLHAASIEWGAEIVGTAQEVLDEAEGVTNPERRGKTAAAMEFIRQALRDGPRLANDIIASGREHGFKGGTLDRAKQDLGVASKKVALGGAWLWSLNGFEQYSNER